MNGVIWAIHSYRQIDGGMYEAFQAEVTVLHRDGQFTRDMIKAALQGFFSHESSERLTALVSANNRKAVRLAKIAGFTLEGRIRRSDKSKEKLIFSILREEYEKTWNNKK